MSGLGLSATATATAARVFTAVLLISWSNALVLRAEPTSSPASDSAPGVYQCTLTIMEIRTAPDGTVERSPAELYLEHVKITDQYEIAKWNAPRHEWNLLCTSGDESCSLARTPRYVVSTRSLEANGRVVMFTTAAFESAERRYEEEFNFVTEQGTSFNTTQTGPCVAAVDPALRPRPKTATSAGRSGSGPGSSTSADLAAQRRHETCVESCEYESETCNLRTRTCELATLGALVYGLADDKDMRDAASAGREKCLEGVRDDCDEGLRACRSSCLR